MIDFLASTTIALIVIMTLVLFFSNQRQASILRQMRMVMEDWYQAQMRDRRETFRDKIIMPDVLQWVGSQVNLTVVEQARKLENPPAAEFLTAEGARLVISPLSKRKLRSALKNSEGKRRKVAKLVQPLLGYHPGRVDVTERSNKTVHEWYEVEIETALEKLGINWVNFKGLYFYTVPQEPEKSKAPLVSFDFSSVIKWFKTQTNKFSGWLKERQANQLSSKPAARKVEQSQVSKIPASKKTVSTKAADKPTAKKKAVSTSPKKSGSKV